MGLSDPRNAAFRGVFLPYTGKISSGMISVTMNSTLDHATR